MMKIAISNTSEKPIYQQIYDQVSAQILKGELKSGFCLPPIRTAALELRVSIITVKKAWEELERQGLIYSMVGRGCFIADLTKSETDAKRERMVDEKIEKEIAFYRGLGMTLESIIEKVKKYY